MSKESDSSTRHLIFVLLKKLIKQIHWRVRLKSITIRRKNYPNSLLLPMVSDANKAMKFGLESLFALIGMFAFVGGLAICAVSAIVLFIMYLKPNLTGVMLVILFLSAIFLFVLFVNSSASKNSRRA
ncbi:MAG: hypothetical protein Dasosvirus14_1 [Dasosvirus sp.]|uniref:Uncharacterized protein n=1 Tax=Dasosvirus sp. TaxID=2487764 RepID=A0A3G4ZVH8_9VIRU|nr:MAG: hypothetical protein Dasosvirus14_1 [Dasosvirus sp.]